MKKHNKIVWSLSGIIVVLIAILFFILGSSTQQKTIKSNKNIRETKTTQVSQKVSSATKNSNESDLGSYINQWKILSEMRKKPLMPAIIGFGRTDQKKLSDNSPLKAPSITKSLVISINGNGVGKPLTYTHYAKNANGDWDSIQKQYVLCVQVLCKPCMP